MNPVLVLALLASWPVEPVAQSVPNWSPAQQEIIDQIRRCKDAWVASFVEKRFEVYDSVCPATEHAVFWYTGSDETPVTYKNRLGVPTPLAAVDGLPASSGPLVDVWRLDRAGEQVSAAAAPGVRSAVTRRGRVPLPCAG